MTTGVDGRSHQTGVSTEVSKKLLSGPEPCTDQRLGPNGNHSFYDHNWGHPPARIGRDPRYRRDRADLQFGNLSPLDPNAIGSPGGHPMSMGMGRYGYGRY